MTLSDFVLACIAKIDTPQKWAVGGLAFYTAPSGKRFNVAPTDRWADCWCSMGAIKAVVGQAHTEDFAKREVYASFVIDMLAKEMVTAVAKFNDTTAHGVVMKAWNEVWLQIELEEAFPA